MKPSRRINTALVLVALALALVSTAWAGTTDIVLYNFVNTTTDVQFPEGGMVFDSAGNLYGTAYYGGAHSMGGVFELSPVAGGWTEQVIYSFAGGSDGKHPYANLAIDASGNLYGFTVTGGSASCSCGQIYELSPSSSGWTKTVLYSFTGGTDGGTPQGALILDSAGNLYGAATLGGANSYGVIYELSPSSSGWSETVLYSFQGNPVNYPTSALVFDSAGRLYGTTYSGGLSNCASGCGVAFQLSPPSGGGSWSLRPIHAFNSTDGGKPNDDSLLIDASGNLYGTTQEGGADNLGVVFELSPTSSGGWKETVLHSFIAHTGSQPTAGLTFDASGNLWGTTNGGGNPLGYGTVFELTPKSGGGWNWKPVYPFSSSPNDGDLPDGTVVFDAAGNLYGTTAAGGTNSQGIVFELAGPLAQPK